MDANLHRLWESIKVLMGRVSDLEIKIEELETKIKILEKK